MEQVIKFTPAILFAGVFVAVPANAVVTTQFVGVTGDVTVGNSTSANFSFYTADYGKYYLHSYDDNRLAGPNPTPVFGTLDTTGPGGTTQTDSNKGGHGSGYYPIMVNLPTGLTGGYATIVGDGQVLESITYDAPAAVPDVAIWAQMIFGFGLAGGALRRRSRALAA